MKGTRSDVAIVGAGPNGLTAAAVRGELPGELLI